MNEATIILQLKSIKDFEKQFTFCMFGLIGQTNVNFKVVLILKKEEKDRLITQIEYLKNFCTVEIEDNIDIALQKIDSEFFTIITGKDIIYPHFLFTLTSFMRDNPGVDLVYGTSFLAKVDEDFIVQSKVRYMGEVFRYRKLLSGNHIYLSSCLFRTKLLKKKNLSFNKFFIYRIALLTKPKYLEKDLSERWEFNFF